MSDEKKQAGEEIEAQAEDVQPGDVEETLVDEVSASLVAEGEGETSQVDMVDASSEESLEEEEVSEELEEEKVKDEIDIQLDLLKDPDWVVRREAVVTLGEMADERCVEPLVRCLRDGDWQVREAAVDAIGLVGSPAVDMLIHYMRDWDARKYVIRALGKINDERVLDPLIFILKNDEFKDDATRALVELGHPAVERLIVALTDKDEFVRKQSILALGDIGSAEAVDPLIAMLQDEDWLIRLTSAASLEKIGDPRGRDAVKPLMKDKDLVVRMRIERILASWKKQPVEPAASA